MEDCTKVDVLFSHSVEVRAESPNAYEGMELSVSTPLELGQTFAQTGMEGRVRATDEASVAVARGVLPEPSPLNPEA